MSRLQFVVALLFLFLGGLSHAQVVIEEDYTPAVSDSGATAYTPFEETPIIDSAGLMLQQIVAERDSLNAALSRSSAHLMCFADSLQHLNSQLVRLQQEYNRIARLKDSLLISNDQFQHELEAKNSLLETKIKTLQEKEQLIAEKEQLYKDALSNSTVNKAQLESDIKVKESNIEAKTREIEFLQREIDSKDNSLTLQRQNAEKLEQTMAQMRSEIDSLKARVVAADLENIRKQEENKYLAQRAKEAENKVKDATNRKKKVRPIQGIAMRFFRTPDWYVSLDPQIQADGSVEYQKVVWNKNAGNVEFDFVTGASVMLWDLTKVFDQRKHDSIRRSILTRSDIPNFDQSFAYDLGLYVGFGGANLFKNFYLGPSFRFMDFFYLNMGVNICEYEVLRGDYHDGSTITANQNLTDIVAKSWLVKPFISFSIDLDFLSYIKK